MADGGDAGVRRWQDEVEPDLRPRVRGLIVRKLAEICDTGQHIGSEKLHKLAADFEEHVFRAAKSKIDYMRKISMKMLCLDQKPQQLRKAAADRQQQMQMVHQMQLDNAVQPIQGGNSLLTATPRAVSTMAGHIRPPSQLSNQHMAGPFAPNMQINVKHGLSDMMAMLNQSFNSQSVTVAPMAPSVQSGQQIMQSSVAIQNQNQHPAVQLQPTSFAGCSQASVAQLQGRPVVRPNAQQNHLHRQNARGICDVQQQTTDVMMRNHQGLGVNQYHMNSQQSQSVGANVANMNTGYPGGWNNQQSAGLQTPFKVCEQEVLKNQTNLESRLITPAKQQSTVNQQSNVHCPSPQTSGTMGRAGEVDWREEMFEQIKSWKDAYFSELMELNRTVVITKIAEEQLQSLPKDKAEAYNRRSSLKHMISCALNFLKLQKSEIPETLRGLLPKFQNTIHNLLDFHGKIKAQNEGTSTGHQSQDCHVKPQIINLTVHTASFTGGKSNHQNWPEQPVNASISVMMQNVVTTTPPARQKPRSNQLQGVRSPPPGGLQSSPTNDVEVCCTPSPIAKLGVVQVASPSALLNSKLQLPIANPGSVAAASPCASVKSTFTSTVEKSGVLASASPCSLLKSTLPSNVAKSGVVPVASPCDSVKSAPLKDSDSVSCFLMHNNEKAAAAAVNDCNQVTPSKQMTAASPRQAQTAVGQIEAQVRSGAETPVAKKKFIDRLLDAVRSSSTAVLGSSVNSMKSVLIAMYSVPLPPWRGSNTRMKRSYDLTSSYSEFPLGSTDGSAVTFEWDVSDSASSGELGAKRQKTQNAKDALLDEIEAINRTLIDTVISIDNVTDGITSCNGGILIKLSYSAISLVPSLESHLATSGMQPLVMPVTLLVPTDYPGNSPVIVDDGGGDRLRTKLGCISDTVDAAFQRALRELPEPRSLKETASAWDACVRRAASEFVCRHGGGTLGSMLGRWESCVGA